MSWLDRGADGGLVCREGVVEESGWLAGLGPGDGAREVRGQCGQMPRVDLEALLGAESGQHFQGALMRRLFILRAGR